MRRRYLKSAFQAEGHQVRIDEISLARAAVKYGAAVAHVARLYRHLQAAVGDFEVEVSVDETSPRPTPSTSTLLRSCGVSGSGG